jgi:hypothetical protein
MSSVGELAEAEEEDMEGIKPDPAEAEERIQRKRYL